MWCESPAQTPTAMAPSRVRMVIVRVHQCIMGFTIKRSNRNVHFFVEKKYFKLILLYMKVENVKVCFGNGVMEMGGQRGLGLSKIYLVLPSNTLYCAYKVMSILNDYMEIALLYF